jgi:RecB family endonuclease NucS
MTSADQLKRTIDACRRAGLPVIEAKQCTCSLRGRLVVLDGPDGLRVLWPYDGRCLVHAPRDREGPMPTGRARQGRSRSPAAPEAWAERKAGAR